VARTLSRERAASFWAAGSFAVTAALAAAQPISNSVDAHSRAADVADSDNPVEYQLGSDGGRDGQTPCCECSRQEGCGCGCEPQWRPLYLCRDYTKTGALLSSAVRTVAAVRRGRAGWPRRMAF